MCGPRSRYSRRHGHPPPPRLPAADGIIRQATQLPFTIREIDHLVHVADTKMSAGLADTPLRAWESTDCSQPPRSLQNRQRMIELCPIRSPASAMRQALGARTNIDQRNRIPISINRCITRNTITEQMKRLVEDWQTELLGQLTDILLSSEALRFWRLHSD